MNAKSIALFATFVVMLPGEALPQSAPPPLAHAQSLKYRSIGPARGGRVTAVAGHAAQPGTFYMGATGGGVFKTMDYGTTWSNVSDGYFATGSIGAIDVADSDSNTVYVGTGSAGLRSNVIIGKGGYKSTDGGKTWTHVGLTNVGQIGSLEVHPQNPDIVLVAAVGNPFGPTPERGVYRTTDGGKSWRRVLFLADSVGASDLAVNPANPHEVYAGMWRAERKPWTIISGAKIGGVYKSSDGGETWTKLTNGLPAGLTGKIAIDVARSNPQRVYVLIEAVPGGGLYRSDDGGRSFQLINSQSTLLNRPFYYTYVHVDPKNADVVYVNNETFWKSTDGGKTFQRRSTPHGDNHGMWINPDNPDLFIQSNDGGANVTTNGGRTWSTQYNQPTAEIYQVAVDNQFPYRIYGAQQDNSTIIMPSLPPDGMSDLSIQLWQQGPGCETGPIYADRRDPQIVYGACKGRFSVLDMRTGQEKQYYVGGQNMYGHNPRDLKYRFQRVSPLEPSPHDPNVIYHASQFVHRTTDGGVTWQTISPDLTANPAHGQVISGTPITRDITGEEFYSTLYSLKESPLTRGLIWVGSNDGPVHVTRDNGRSWKNVTPRGLPPGGRVQTVEPSPHNPAKAYVAVLRYQLNDFQPYLYRTTDYGQSWTRITNGIPNDHPTRVIREDPTHAGLLYAGTEFGMFVSHDDGASWQSLQFNLPATPVTDMEVHNGDLVLSTMGRSFWILDDLTPLRQWSSNVVASDVHLFRPDTAYRVRYRASEGGDAEPTFPPAGAVIDYYLSSSDPVTLEIHDASGRVIRAFSSDSGATPARGEQEMRGPPARAGAASSLPSARGVNRFIWDFNTRLPSDTSQLGRSSVLALPGAYTVQLTAAGKTVTQPLVVRMDPRLERAGVTLADLREQYDLNVKIQEAIAEGRTALRRLRSAMEELKKTSPQSNVISELNAIEARLTAQQGIKYPQPMLIEQFSYLYEMTNSADQKVGRVAFERFNELRSELDKQLAALRRALGETAVSSTGT